MEWVNETLVREFVFLGFSSLAGLQRLLFVVFLLVYLFTLGTNAVIISTIVLDRALHTPMYFFLAVLSCSETCYTFVIVPKMLVDLLAQKKTISFLGCAIQMFTFLFLGCSHSFLLAAMGYDRYVAICNPLRYTVLMGHGVCVGLVAAACFCGFTVAQIITSMVFHLPFHSSNQLHHFFCDISPVLKMFTFLFLGCSHSFLLAAMGYDRYVAICNPLRYTVLMGHGVCVGLVAAACFCGFTVSLVTTSLVFRLPFHSSHQLHHFFCDISPVLKLASHRSRLSQLVIFMLGVFVLVIPLLLIMVSYVRIISAVLKIPSTVGRYKAFSTCASHLIVVTVHYGCASFIYLRPKSNYSSSQDTLISVSYTILTPLFNPMIYSLRNKEFKSALRRAIIQTSHPVN
ncbi:olfactory receptor 10K1 [Camelus ferus]|nr:olfactory receptor 10K1 [Camelus ferus]